MKIQSISQAFPNLLNCKTYAKSEYWQFRQMGLLMPTIPDFYKIEQAIKINFNYYYILLLSTLSFM